jgi:hypothetical protein
MGVCAKVAGQPMTISMSGSDVPIVTISWTSPNAVALTAVLSAMIAITIMSSHVTIAMKLSGVTMGTIAQRSTL